MKKVETKELLNAVATFGEYDRTLSELDMKEAGVLFAEMVDTILLAYMDKFKINIATGSVSPIVSGIIEDTSPEMLERQSREAHPGYTCLDISVCKDPGDGQGGYPRVQIVQKDERGDHIRYDYILEPDGVVHRGDTDEDAQWTFTDYVDTVDEDGTRILGWERSRSFYDILEQAKNCQTEVELGFNNQPVGTEEVKKLITLIEMAGL